MNNDDKALLKNQMAIVEKAARRYNALRGSSEVYGIVKEISCCIDTFLIKIIQYNNLDYIKNVGYLVALYCSHLSVKDTYINRQKKEYEAYLHNKYTFSADNICTDILFALLKPMNQISCCNKPYYEIIDVLNDHIKIAEANKEDDVFRYIVWFYEMSIGAYVNYEFIFSISPLNKTINIKSNSAQCIYETPKTSLDFYGFTFLAGLDCHNNAYMRI